MQEISFQQYGARSHMENAVLHFPNDHFHNRVISNLFSEPFVIGWSWSPYSLDLILNAMNVSS
jgi:hypothetical protein